jgi:hypothetical protein
MEPHLMCLQHLDVFMKYIVSNFHMGMCDRCAVMHVPVYVLVCFFIHLFGCVLVCPYMLWCEVVLS